MKSARGYRIIPFRNIFRRYLLTFPPSLPLPVKCTPQMRAGEEPLNKETTTQIQTTGKKRHCRSSRAGEDDSYLKFIPWNGRGDLFPCAARTCSRVTRLQAGVTADGQSWDNLKQRGHIWLEFSATYRYVRRRAPAGHSARFGLYNVEDQPHGPK